MRNISLTQKYKQAVTDWNAKQQFTLFGTIFNESKIEDYDDRSWFIVQKNYYDEIMRTGNDYWINLMFQERIAMEQRSVRSNFSLIAAMEKNEEHAFVKLNDKLTKEVWVGDTGASCHMRSSLSGMFDLKPGTGGIKVGSGNICRMSSSSC